MIKSNVYFVGSSAEVAHHAAPLAEPLGCRVVSAEEILPLAKPGDVALFYSEHFDRFRNAVYELNQKRVATVYVVDGILEWRNAWENRPDEVACPHTMRPVLAHKVACIGPSQQRVLNMWGNEPKTEVVGIPRLDKLPLPADPAMAPADNVLRILVATAKTPAFTDEQTARVERSLLDLREFFATHKTIGDKQVEVVWRLTDQLAAKLNVDNTLQDLTGKDLATQLAHVNTVITTASTSMVEGMLYDIPVALLDYHNTPAYVQTAWSIRSECQIEPVLQELANPSDRKMVFQRGQLHDTLFLQSEGSVRLAELVGAMQKIAEEQIAADQPLNFPANLLPPVEPAGPHSVDYDLESLFADAAEFSIQDRRELQALLASSRREIDQLKLQLLIRESELDQAHQIFDKVNSHPLIGPVVKLRKRLQTLLGATSDVTASPKTISPRSN